VPVAIEAFGDAALRIAMPAGTHASRLLDALRTVAGVVDAVVAERHAVVTFEPGLPPSGVSEAVERAAVAANPFRTPEEHVVSVVYDGEDLAAVAARVGLSTADVVKLHVAPSYDVVAVGFLPGFAYLRGLDARLVTPRRSTPRSRVPPCAVAVAGPYTGVYPLASPGGWNLIGTATGFTPFSPSSGATLALGDRVRFVESGGRGAP
jgi:UPF0271 protein